MWLYTSLVVQWLAAYAIRADAIDSSEEVRSIPVSSHVVLLIWLLY